MKFLFEKWDDTVEIHYENLPVNNYDFSGYVDWIYKPFKDDVKDFLMDFVPEEIANSTNDKVIEDYLEDNFDTLFDDNIKAIEKHFKEDAIEDANINYYPDDDEDDGDAYHRWLDDQLLKNTTNESYEEGYDDIEVKYYIPYWHTKGTNVDSLIIYKDKDDIYGYKSDYLGQDYGFKNANEALNAFKEEMMKNRVILDYEVLNSSKYSYRDALKIRDNFIE